MDKVSGNKPIWKRLLHEYKFSNIPLTVPVSGQPAILNLYRWAVY